MNLFPEKEIDELKLKRGLHSITIDGLMSQAMTTLTGGIFLVALAVSLNSSNFYVGLLAAIPPLAQLFQIPAVLLIEKFKKRKIISVINSLISRLFLLAIPFFIFFTNKNMALLFLLTFIFLSAVFGAVSGCSWNSWMRDLVPKNILGSFFSRRMFWSIALGLLLSMAAGYFIDLWKLLAWQNIFVAYSLIFLIGAVFGLLGVYFIARIPEPKMEKQEEGAYDIWKIITAPFKEVNFKNLVIFTGSFNFAVNLAAPFFTVFMLKRLSLDFSLIIVFSIVSQIMTLLFLQLWGKYTDRFSNKSVLAVTGMLFFVCILAWSFTAMPEKYFLTIPLIIAIHVFTGISTAGVTVATGNIGLKLAPREQATAYLAGINLVNSLAAGFAPILGGVLADFFMRREFNITLNWISPDARLQIMTLYLKHWDFLFFIAFFIGLYSLHRLSLVTEEGEVDKKIVLFEFISEVRRHVRSVSSVTGLRYLFEFPFSLVVGISKKIPVKKRK